MKSKTEIENEIHNLETQLADPLYAKLHDELRGIIHALKWVIKE